MHKNSKILFIGIEKEGAWESSRGLNIGDDGSVNIPKATPIYDCEGGEGLISGEVRSEPFDKLRSLSQWIKRCHPDKVNQTCGVHVHLSVKKIEDFALLMHRKFFDVFLQSMTRWGQKHCSSRSYEDQWFRKRLNGENQFCLKEHYPILQLKYQREKYSMLNYQSYRNFKTIECRIFPAFRTVDKTISAISHYIRTVDFYLKHQKPNEYTQKYLAELKKYS
jgi:hypothetical protein